MPFVPADAGNEMVQASARWGSSQDTSAFIVLGLIVPVFQAAFPIVPDWMLFVFPTRSLGLNIDHLPLQQQSTQTLCCSLFLSGSWNCSGWFYKQEVSAAWVTRHRWRCRLLVSKPQPSRLLHTNTPQCTKACGLPKLAQSCSFWINEAGRMVQERPVPV